MDRQRHTVKDYQTISLTLKYLMEYLDISISWHLCHPFSYRQNMYNMQNMYNTWLYILRDAVSPFGACSHESQSMNLFKVSKFIQIKLLQTAVSTYLGTMVELNVSRTKLCSRPQDQTSNIVTLTKKLRKSSSCPNWTLHSPVTFCVTFSKAHINKFCI